MLDVADPKALDDIVLEDGYSEGLGDKYIWILPTKTMSKVAKDEGLGYRRSKIAHP